jgi:phosphohistidine phosphatase SixA
MKLYFLRHATAEDIAASDAKRQLTKVGHEEARVAGAALAKLEALIDKSKSFESEPV